MLSTPPPLHGEYPRHVSTHDPDLWIPPLVSTAKRRPALKSVTSFRTIFVDPVTRREKLAESKLESDVRDVALADRRIEAVEDQPGLIHYVDDDGRQRDHWLDFRFLLSDGCRLGVLVKPEAGVERRGLHALVDTLNRQAAHVADRFTVITERHVPRARVANAKLILRARRTRDEDAVAMVAKVTDCLVGQVSIRTLAEFVEGHPGSVFLALVNLLDDGRIVPVGNGRITLDTVIGRATQAHAHGSKEAVL